MSKADPGVETPGYSQMSLRDGARRESDATEQKSFEKRELTSPEGKFALTKSDQP